MPTNAVRIKTDPDFYEPFKIAQAYRVGDLIFVSGQAAAMRAAGFVPGVPRVQMYTPVKSGGMGHEHAYTYAAAALCDQFDRALCGGKGEPARLAVEDAMASACCQAAGFHCEAQAAGADARARARGAHRCRAAGASVSGAPRGWMTGCRAKSP